MTENFVYALIISKSNVIYTNQETEIEMKSSFYFSRERIALVDVEFVSVKFHFNLNQMKLSFAST